MRITTNTLRTRSASVRPTSTADRAMGSERNRSSIPDFRSAAKPTAVAIAPNTTVCTKMPGIRKSTYGTPASVGLTAPPNTYRQSSTKITGWIVEKMRSCGIRMKWIRSRCVTAHVSRILPNGIRRSYSRSAVTAVTPLPPSPSAPSAGRGHLGRLRVFGVMAGRRGTRRPGSARER